LLSRGTIYDNVWRERFGYLSELSRFGLISSRSDNSAVIHHSVFSNARASAPDLRGGAACVLCALAAEGQSVIENAEMLLRGYEGIDKKLRALGADIKIRNKERKNK
jgi:UDP-N-acetylglucosamine 1-carboxyvinyltransferase